MIEFFIDAFKKGTTPMSAVVAGFNPRRRRKLSPRIEHDKPLNLGEGPSHTNSLYHHLRSASRSSVEEVLFDDASRKEQDVLWRHHRLHRPPSKTKLSLEPYACPPIELQGGTRPMSMRRNQGSICTSTSGPIQ